MAGEREQSDASVHQANEAGRDVYAAGRDINITHHHHQVSNAADAVTAAAKRNDGREFENTVARWLSVDGWRVEREQIAGHKKIDLLLRRERWGSEWRVAVECKDYERALDRQTVVQVWADYELLVSSGSIDELLIVTANGFAPSAVTYVKSVRGLHLPFNLDSGHMGA